MKLPSPFDIREGFFLQSYTSRLIDAVILRMKQEGRPLSEFDACMDEWTRESEEKETTGPKKRTSNKEASSKKKIRKKRPSAKKKSGDS